MKFYSATVFWENFEDLIQFMKTNSVFVMNEGAKQGDEKKVDEGDILLLKDSGQSPSQFIGYGRAKESVKEIEDSTNKGWNKVIPVEGWVFKNSNNKKDGVNTTGYQSVGFQQLTVHELDENWAFQKMREINDQSNLYKEVRDLKKK